MPKLEYQGVTLLEINKATDLNEDAKSAVLFILYSLTTNHFVIGEGCRAELKLAVEHLGVEVGGEQLENLVELSKNAELVTLYTEVVHAGLECLRTIPDLEIGSEIDRKSVV